MNSKSRREYLEKASKEELIEKFLEMEDRLLDSNMNAVDLVLKADSANEAKSRFLAAMSHEIRTPMHAVLGMTNLLKESGLSVQQLNYVNTIEVAGENLISIIDDILDYSKVEAGMLKFEHVDFNLYQLLADVVKLYRGKALSKKIMLKFRSDFSNEFFVSGDPLRIKQILNNLLGNAVKFTEEGSITVDVKSHRLKKDRVFVKFRVVDTGIGIEANKIKYLFKPFTQEDEGVTRHYGGSGLGLSIIKSIVDLFKGKVRLKSRKGIGTIFSVQIVFDIGKSIKVEKKKVEKNIINNPLERKRILVADDGEFNLKLLCLMLSSLGYEFDTTMNGKIALEMFKKDSYDIVLMDCHMPEMDGYTASKLIREYEINNKLNKIPIIALTANAQGDNKEKCLQSGMDDFLSKPFKKEQLAEKIAFWIKKKS